MRKRASNWEGRGGGRGDGRGEGQKEGGRQTFFLTICPTLCPALFLLSSRHCFRPFSAYEGNARPRFVQSMLPRHCSADNFPDPLPDPLPDPFGGAHFRWEASARPALNPKPLCTAASTPPHFGEISLLGRLAGPPPVWHYKPDLCLIAPPLGRANVLQVRSRASCCREPRRSLARSRR